MDYNLTQNSQLKNKEKTAKDGAGFGVAEKKDGMHIYNDNNRVKSSNSKKRDLPPKLVFGALLILAVGTLVFGFANLSRNIYGPKDSFNAQNAATAQVNESSVITDLLTLKNNDTDKDGLNDYDEEYVYKTSIYLADTDSDGFSDKQEVEAGYDPLCPAGQDCRGIGSEEQSTTTTTEGLGVGQATGTDAGLPQNLKDELNKLTPTQVRQLILESGQMTQEQLDVIDDATLMSIFTEVLSQ